MVISFRNLGTYIFITTHKQLNLRHPSEFNMKSIGITKRLLVIVFAMMTIFSMNMVIAYAELMLNGSVDEADWNYWFTDDSGSPVVDVYWSDNSDYLYIGIVTDDSNENSDYLEFAFKGGEEDYSVQIIPGGSTHYSVRTSVATPLFQGWWQTSYTGLPPGVNVVTGYTLENRSYEISIELSILGNRAGDLPESFEFYYKVQDGHPDGPSNYPDSYMSWNFNPDNEQDDGEEELVPTFHVPELPMGTIMALISMLLAMVIFTKKPSVIQMLR